MTWFLLMACGGPATDPCETAFAELDAMRAGFEEQTETLAPHRETFLAACRGLPEEAQRCLSVRYATGHPGCWEVLEAIPPDGRVDLDGTTRAR